MYDLMSEIKAAVCDFPLGHGSEMTGIFSVYESEDMR